MSLGMLSQHFDQSGAFGPGPARTVDVGSRSDEEGLLGMLRESRWHRGLEIDARGKPGGAERAGLAETSCCDRLSSRRGRDDPQRPPEVPFVQVERGREL